VVDDVPGSTSSLFGRRFSIAGSWTKFGKGVLGRIMPAVLGLIILQDPVIAAFAWQDPSNLLLVYCIGMASIVALIGGAFLWAHFNPAIAANEGKEASELLKQYAAGMATKSEGPLPPTANVADPMVIERQTVIGAKLVITGELPPPQPALPSPKVSRKKDPK
jgi:hypothetical protein